MELNHHFDIIAHIRQLQRHSDLMTQIRQKWTGRSRRLWIKERPEMIVVMQSLRGKYPPSGEWLDAQYGIIW
jgi:hypothetical protein